MEKYNKQAVEFLNKTNTTLEIIKAPFGGNKPLWVKYADKFEDYGNEYFIRLKNKNGEYRFSFWGSISDRENNKKPNAYDVLACLDTYSDGYEFSDFCNAFGYSTDSILASKTYKAVMKQTEKLKMLFNEDELELLTITTI